MEEYKNKEDLVYRLESDIYYTGAIDENLAEFGDNERR